MTIPRLIGIYIMSLLLVSGIFAHYENKTFFEGFYWASVTATTIGYGDLLPTQTITRCVMIIFAHFQVFLCIPSIIALIMMKSIRNLDLFTHKEQEWMEDALEKIATKLNIELQKAPDGEE